MDKYGIFIISNNVYVREDGEDDNTSSDLRSIIDGLKSVNPDLAIQLDLLAVDCWQFNLLINLQK